MSTHGIAYSVHKGPKCVPALGRLSDNFNPQVDNTGHYSARPSGLLLRNAEVKPDETVDFPVPCSCFHPAIQRRAGGTGGLTQDGSAIRRQPAAPADLKRGRLLTSRARVKEFSTA